MVMVRGRYRVRVRATASVRGNVRARLMLTSGLALRLPLVP